MLCLAMAEHPEAERYAGHREDLINGMLLLQRPSGMFLTAFRSEVEVQAQDYFPGEALLAMAAHYRLDPSTHILQAFHRAISFYREYFQPDEIKEIVKHRRRFHIMYRGVRFEINLDRLLEPKHDQLLLEIKSRTWSSSDAERKAQLLTELLDVLGVDRERLVKREYVDF